MGDRAPLRRTIEATADQYGAIRFEFEQTNANEAWTGPVLVGGAPIAAQFSAVVADVPWGQWSGPSASPQVQAADRLQLVVTGVGLVPYADYRATWLTITDRVDLAPVIYPTMSYAVAPFASLPIVSEQAATVPFFSAVSYPDNTGAGAFDTSGWAAVRLAMSNNSVGSPGATLYLVVSFRDVTDTFDIGQRIFVLDDPLTLRVTIPVLGDRMRLSVANLAAVATDGTFTIQATLITAPAVGFVVNDSTGLNGDGFLVSRPSTNINGGATITDECNSLFAGQTSLSVNLRQFTNFTVAVQYADITGAWQNLRLYDQLTNPGKVIQDNFLVPAAPLRLRITNDDGVVHSVSGAWIADTFRAA